MAERLAAAYRVVQWRNDGEPVRFRDALDYAAALRVIFGAGHEAGAEGGAVAPSAADAEPISALRWASVVGDARLGFSLYAALPHLCQPLA